jgi:hypothetical protein
MNEAANEAAAKVQQGNLAVGQFIQAQDDAKGAVLWAARNAEIAAEGGAR